jgi:hypothetical protein
MTLDVVIPTLNRKTKLINCVESIITNKKDYDIIVYLYFSSVNELDEFRGYWKLNWILLDFTMYNKCTVFWNSHLKKMEADAMCYLNDDVTILPDTFDQIFQIYPHYFPDYDGVLGLNQVNIPYEQIVKSAFGVIGTKYANRFPDRQVFCPNYYRFYDDKELQEYAESINKFHFDENIKLIHHHPAHSKQQRKDDTHVSVRKYKSIDSHIFNMRQNKKYLWGKDFNLVNYEKV